MRNKREPQLENVVCVNVRRRQCRPGAHVASEFACVLVLEHQHPVSHQAAMGLVFLLERENRRQSALLRAADVLVRLVEVPPAVLPEALDVLGVDEAQVRLAVCTLQLGAMAVRSRDVVLTDVLLGRSDVPVRPLLEDLFARVVEDVLHHWSGSGGTHAHWSSFEHTGRDQVAETQICVEVVLRKVRTKEAV
jgi:hypothetical protein